ncbi:MAG TPA: prolyl oligopeptidase family serine peptidase [Micromonosporaceae bacterium]
MGPAQVEPSRTGHPRYEPHAVTVSDDGSRVMYLRAAGPDDTSDRLWVFDVNTGVERLVTEAPVREYAADTGCRVVGYVTGEELHRVRPGDREPVRIPTAGTPYDVRPDPTGRRLAYRTGNTLRVIDEHGADELLAGEPGVVWGGTDRVSTEVFGRRRGYWWSPDGERVLATRLDRGDPRAPWRLPVTSLHLLELDGFWVDVRWDRQGYPHLAAVTWGQRGGPLATVLPRSQHHALVLAVDSRTGETQVHAEVDDPRWVSVTPGTPAYLPDGRVVLGGELNLDAVETRCLFADGILLTPPQLYVRRLLGRLPGPAEHVVDLLVEASEGEPSERHVYRLRLAAKSSSPEVTRLTTEPGWHTGYGAGSTLVIASESLDHSGVRTVVRGPAGEHEIPRSDSRAPRTAQSTPPRPTLSRVTDRRLPCAVLYPTEHVTGRKLPVLVTVTDNQGVVAARSRWWRHQWYADQGFAVVVIDGRGTPGVSPGFEKAIYRRVLDVTLTDQTEGLAALAAKHPDLDLDRVAVRGSGLGGSIAVAAAIRHPDVYRVAVAEAPITDWTVEPVGFAERYLGSYHDNPEAYAQHDLVAVASELVRPLLLISPPDTPRDRQARRLVDALRAARRPYRLVPAATDQDVLRFVRRGLETGP